MGLDGGSLKSLGSSGEGTKPARHTHKHTKVGGSSVEGGAHRGSPCRRHETPNMGMDVLLIWAWACS
eukprot:821081-Prymnesium_polylepis.1